MTDDVDDEPADPALSGNDPEVVDAKKMLGLFDQPAFMRRAKQLEFELDRFDASLLATRREYLAPVAMRYKMLKLAQQKSRARSLTTSFSRGSWKRLHRRWRSIPNLSLLRYCHRRPAWRGTI